MIGSAINTIPVLYQHLYHAVDIWITIWIYFFFFLILHLCNVETKAFIIFWCFIVFSIAHNFTGSLESDVL